MQNNQTYDADELNPAYIFNFLIKFQGAFLHQFLILAAEFDIDQAAEGRKFQGRAQGQFPAEKTLIIVIPGRGNAVMIRLVGLDYDPAWFFSPTGPAADLAEQLKGSFPGPEIRHAQAAVSPDNSHQSHVGKMMALGNHLGADEDICFIVPDLF